MEPVRIIFSDLLFIATLRWNDTKQDFFLTVQTLRPFLLLGTGNGSEHTAGIQCFAHQIRVLCRLLYFIFSAYNSRSGMTSACSRIQR